MRSFPTASRYAEKRGLRGDLGVILWSDGDCVHWGSRSESGAMRGKHQQSDNLFSYIRLETRIPVDHPLRPIRKLVDKATAGVVAGLR
jgi:hypothetical protein